MIKRDGLYLAFDGGEGGGKTTVVKKLARELAERGMRHRAIREPGGTKLGDALRVVLLNPDFKGEIDATEELLLMSVARSALMRSVRAALDAGEVVVSDRTAAATYAYQLVARNRHDLSGLLDAVNREIVIWPDMLFIFDLDPRIGIGRVESRNDGKTRFDAEDLRFHERVREGFLAFAAAAPCPVRIIDASRSEEEVWCEVLACTGALLEGRVA